MASPAPRFSLLGTDAVLFDPADAAFDDGVQARVWAVCAAAERLDWVREATPGMNNLMVAFDSGAATPDKVREALAALWEAATPAPDSGRIIEAPTIYGGEVGVDLKELAARAGLDVKSTVRLHADRLYGVAAVGAMPGFPYLSGLDPALHWARLATPRPKAPEGAVMIGAAQAGIMPCEAPTGWRLIGSTSLKLFDPMRDEPATLRPGDRVRFVIEDIRA
jgi:KipI family sensor histidine kinase inhibitor